MQGFHSRDISTKIDHCEALLINIYKLMLEMLRFIFSDRTIDIPHSSVIFLCDEDATIPVFKTEDEDNYVSLVSPSKNVNQQ